MQQNYPFQPNAGATTTATLVVTGSNQALTLPTPWSDGGTIRLLNSGTQVIFWCYGAGPAAAATSTPMLPNTVETFTLPAGVTALAVIAPTTGSTLYATLGMGE